MEEKLKDEDEIEIDLRRYFGLLLDRKKLVGCVIAVCTLMAMIYSFVIPPTFESSTLVQTQNTNKIDVSGASAAMALLGMNGGASSTTNNYIEMMKSRTVLEPIMDVVFSELSEEEREKMTAKKFAGRLEIENIKGTNLINVTAKGKSPEEAQMIANSVVENFLKMMTDINQHNQSYMVKFLNERIDTAKQESDDASNKLEQYSREHKIYEPDAQTSAMLEREAIYNKTLSELLVQQQAAGARIDAVSSELEKQNASISAFNIADSSVVTALREQIVNQEVAIVQMEQKYTENHPDLRNAKEQLVALKDSLTREVADAVASGTVSMNPTQSALIQDLAQAQVDIAVAGASEAAIRAQMTNADADLAQLSEDALEYIKLKRDAEIKNEVYIALVKQSEQSKIEATMESMDIQVIDKADLPKQKSAPNRKLLSMLGLFVGVCISLTYVAVIYLRQVRK